MIAAKPYWDYLQSSVWGGVDCFELAARGRANEWKIGGTWCGEFQQTVESVDGSVMAKAFGSK